MVDIDVDTDIETANDVRTRSGGGGRLEWEIRRVLRDD